MAAKIATLSRSVDVEDKELILAQEATGLEAQAIQFEVASDNDMVTATNLLGAIATAKKTLEEQRKFLVAPLNNHVKSINNRFKEYSLPLERADKILRGKVMAYRQEQERKRREEEERLRKLAEKEQAKLAKKAAKKGLPEPPPIIIPHIEAPVRTVQADFGTASVKKVWTYEIVNENEIPREYLVVNEKKIAAVVKAGIREIPGVRIFETEQLAVRAR